MELLANELGIRLEQVCVFGDYYNEISMFNKAGLSIAMGNAVEELKGVADYITDDNDSEGVSKAIEKILLMRLIVAMKIRRIILDEIERCYSTGAIYVDGQLKLIFASEAIDGPCYSYSGENFEKKEVVWDKGGGTMSIIQYPNQWRILAIKDFSQV